MTEQTQSPFPTLAEVEEAHIRKALTLTNGSKAKAAQLLGVTTKTVYNKLNQYAKRTSLDTQLANFAKENADAKKENAQTLA